MALPHSQAVHNKVRADLVAIFNVLWSHESVVWTSGLSVMVVYQTSGFTPAWIVSEWWLARTGYRDRRSA